MIVAAVGDGFLATQYVGAPQLWPRLLAAMGRSDLDRDLRFDTSEKAHSQDKGPSPRGAGPSAA